MLTDSKTSSESIPHLVSPAGDQFLEDPGETSPAELPRGRPGSLESHQPPCVPLVDAVALEWHVRRVFDRNAPFTVGAEEELLLLDTATTGLRQSPRARLHYSTTTGVSCQSCAARRSSS